MTIAGLTHPDYDLYYDDWCKYRYTYEGGRAFIDQYLKQFSTRESAEEFEMRRCMTYVPAFAKSAVNDVKNAIFQRITDVIRRDGSSSYMRAVNGIDGGVDLLGSTMNSFIGKCILPELLPMRRVGIFVDMPALDGVDMYSNQGKRPYLYTYRVEDIRCWSLDNSGRPNEFSSLLLTDCNEYCDATTGLVTGYSTNYRLLQKTPDGVLYTLYDEEDNIIAQSLLKLSRIPFVLVDIGHSLLEDAADYQIALMNMASSDVAFAVKANFPLYTESFNPAAEANELLKKDNKIKMGVTVGRRYPIGADRPEFIHPSPEPLQVSMEKQAMMKEEIRQLINLSLSNMDPKMASAESKQLDNQGLEAGLSFIGLVLEQAERQIAQIWSEYENTDVATVKYPEQYSLTSDSQKRKDAQELSDLLSSVPSPAYRVEIHKMIARTLIGPTVSAERLDFIYGEIEKSNGITVDYKSIASDVEQGLLSAELGSKLRGYPEGEADKAKQEHADRLARIQQSQTIGTQGVPDTTNPTDGKQQKKASRDTTQTELGSKTRGAGK